MIIKLTVEPLDPAPVPKVPFTQYEKDNKIFPHGARGISGFSTTEIFALDLQLKLKDKGLDIPVCFITKPNLISLAYYYVHESIEAKSEFFECRSDEIEFPHIHFMTYSAGAYNRPHEVQETIPKIVTDVLNYYMVRRISEYDKLPSINDVREPKFWFNVPKGEDFSKEHVEIMEFAKTNTDLKKIEFCYASEKGFSLPMNEETRKRQIAYYDDGNSFPPYKDARFVTLPAHKQIVAIRNWKNSWSDEEFIALRTSFELCGVKTFATLQGALQ